MDRHLQRIVGLILVGILIAGALVGGGWWLGQRSERQPAASGVTSTPSSTPPAPDTTAPPSSAPAGTWQRLPAAPIPGGSYAGVWTGTELLLHAPLSGFQGERYVSRSVGAAYHPTTRTWRNLPPAPGPVQNMEGGYHAVWSGRELLGWGMGLDAAYNPATNRWRRIAAGGSAWAVMVWTGQQVLTWGGGCCGDDAAAYNPATRSWRRLPALPEPRSGATVTWNGRDALGVDQVAGCDVVGAHGDPLVGVAAGPAKLGRWPLVEHGPGQEHRSRTASCGPRAPGGAGMRRIVVGIDGSQSSVHAARFAGELAEAIGAELVVVNVQAPTETPDGPMPARMAAVRVGYGRERTRWARQRAEGALAGMGLSWSFLECKGDPAQQLEAMADKKQADLLVVGAHGLGPAEHLGTTRLGWVATRMAHQGHLPVLIVR